MKKLLLFIAILIFGMGLFAQNIGDTTVIDYDGYSLKYTVTSTDPAECEVVCSEQPTAPTEITIPSTMFIGSGSGQTEIIIEGNDSSTSETLPTYEYYCYSVTQQIYTAEEIQVNAGLITSIAFRQTDFVGDTRNLEVYMLNTNVDYIENEYSWFNVTPENLVFSDNVSYPAEAGGWLYLEFQKPFVYEGENIVVCVVDKTGSWTESKCFDAYGTGTNRAMYAYSDESAYDLTNLSNYYATLTSYVNVVKFNYSEGAMFDVTSIGENAFYQCENLTGVEIPNSVTTIGEYAFADCSSLESIYCDAENVPETAENAFDGVPSDMKVSVPMQSVESYKTTSPWSNFMVVGPYELQFAITSAEPAECEVRCLLKPISETTLTIPSTVTIDDVVYSVTSIADSAFLGCDKFIGDLVIPNTVRSVGIRAFRDCVGFDGTLTLSENLETIGDLAFAGGYDVNVNYTGKLTIPNSVEYIGMAAFQNCSSLTSLEFEEGSQITSLEQNVFRNCSSLTGNLQIPNSVTSIGDYAFSGCYNLTGDLLIPNTVTSVGVEAFWECRGFNGTLTLSENLEVISDRVFGSYDGQMSFSGTLVIPSGVKSIGQAAFQNCANILLLEIEENSQLETIGDYAFTQCYSLGGDLLIPNTVTNIGDYAFNNTSINSLNFEENSELNYIGSSAFQYCYNLSGDLLIPNTVTSIGNYAFYFCSGLTSIEIPASLAYFGQDAITGCSNITSIIVEEGNSVYDSRNNCNAIIETGTNTLVAGCKETVIPNTVTSIGFAAFSGCLNLTSIEIPSSVSYIDSFGFYQCYELKSLYCYAENVPETGSSVFDGGVPSDMVVYVPAQSVDAYQAVFPWNNFTILPLGKNYFWTTYDLQSNANVSNRMYQKENGDVVVVTTHSHEFNSMADDRGTGYNIYDGEEWTLSSDNREESNATGADMRTGWPTIAPYGEEGEILVNHSNGLNYYIREKAGEGQWDGPYSIPAPILDGREYTLSWPRVTTSGENKDIIHIACASQYTDEYTGNIVTVQFYCRSTDGQNWEVGYSPLAETDEHITIYDADDYTISSNGDVVAICYASVFYGDVLVYKSTDNGQSWERMLVWENPFAGNWETDENTLTGDTPAQTPVHSTCVVGPDGTVHVAFSVINYIHNELGTSFNYYYGRTNDGIAYWNDTREPLTNIKLWIEDSGYSVHSADSVNFCGWLPFYSNIADFNSEYVYREQDYIYQYYGCISGFPALSVDPVGNLALAYSTIDTERELYDGQYYYRSVYVSYKEAGQESWNVAAENLMEQISANNIEANFVTAVGNSVKENEFYFSFVGDSKPGFYFGTGASQSQASNNNVYVVKYDPDGDIEEPIVNHWTPDESIYPNNMTLIGSVQIDGVSQNSTMLEVGAFCGDELRGSQIAQYIPELGKYEVFLMIYGEANDEITFKLYDHSAKEELDLVSPDAVTFAVNGTLGSVETPYILNFISSEQQIRNLKSGWNWFSSYIELEGGEGLEMMEDALGENGLQIKNQSAFVTNSSSGWYGSLTSVSVQDMFMIETSDTVTMTLEGPKVNPEDYTFSLSQGWKWISYPVSESLSVEDAFANLTPNHGDNIKSQTAFSQYYNGIGWIGGLNTMNPGEGYMYRNSSDETKTLVYPSSSESKGALKANATAENNHWIPNVGQFANNMNLIAVVENNSETDYEIGAFVGDEVRGSARPIYIEALDSYMIFMTIFGEANEELTFKYYDLNAKEENVFTEENIIFSANAVSGSVDNPVVMMFDTESIAENGMENVKIYPNPADVNSEINLGMTCERVEIYNVLGVKIAEYSNVNKIDGMETAGVYIIRVMNDNEMRNYRVVVE